jgi:lipopolysaccharide/colanic/teichoic acid biosynthesis glycosyltransferase
MQSTTQQSIKRVFDILLTIAGIIFLLPLIILTAILVLLSSKGPVFFSQERVGQHQKPFMIWKFRSMYITAEEHGPQLSSDEDSRVTAWGKIMRRWRLDELPQLLNVLKGDMSIVGPRPERKYFIDRIIVTHPEYLNLLHVKPGLTSMGMVKFGYAENVEEMIERMKYDLAYVQHPSFALDITIMLQSVQVIFAGKGK